MKIALLFGIFPPDNYTSIIQNSKGVIQYAADALQKALIEGIGSSDISKDIEIINLPFIGSYPQRYTMLYSPCSKFQLTTQNNNIINGANIRFCNWTIYKLYSRYKASKKSLKKWIKTNNDNEYIIIIYSIHTPFLKAAVEIKQKYHNKAIKVILVVPDLPEYMGGNSTALTNIMRQYNYKIQNQLYKEIDAFVLLSEYMTERLPIDNKPYTVIEGIFNKTLSPAIQHNPNSKRSNKKTLFYSGTLAQRYGILTLVEAVHSMKEQDIELIICGDGDSKHKIIGYTNIDKRIIYKGQLPHNKILELQRQATLLINPRTPEGEFTKYSFPSKTMEYLASGTPTLLYKLPGIPNEYYNYCFTIEEIGVEPLKNKIIEILNCNDDFLSQLGSNAKKFILEEKNPIKQTKKLIQLINQIK